MNLNRALKQGLAPVVAVTGADRFLTRNRVVILMYHRVLPDRQWERPMTSRITAIRASDFEAQMDYLARTFAPLSFEDYLAMPAQGRAGTGRGQVIVTFDDGWADNYTEAYPRLKKKGIPATIFIPTKFPGAGRPFWWHWIGEGLLAIPGEAACVKRLEETVNAFGLNAKAWMRCIRVANPRDRVPAIDALIESLKIIPADGLDRLCEKLRDVFGNASDGSEILTPGQMEEMSSGGISFGSHTANHAILIRLTAAEVEREARQSFEDLQNMHGIRSVPVFCYPGGAWTPDIAEIVRKCGYKAAVTVDRGVNPMVPPDPFALKRVAVDPNTAPLPRFRLLLAQAGLGL